ncbi:MAG: FIST C-terminal domain-containing protein [Desulfobacterales bacterium]|jgi:hypothetical protein|nr:FIST C-terminal domain-containing protein [Desulfobacterales bacterium]
MKVGTGFSNHGDSWESGRAVAEQALQAGGIDSAELVFAFCSNRTDPKAFFQGLQSVVGEKVPIIGGSAIGVITNSELSYTGHPCGALAVQAGMPFCRIAASDGLNYGEVNSGKNLAEQLGAGPDDQAMVVFYDSIKQPPGPGTPPFLNSSMPLIEGIEAGLSQRLPIYGAGLIGDYEFNPTVQFCGSQVSSQSAVAAIFHGAVTLRHRIMHGCTPLDGIYHRVTRAEGGIIFELDGKPIVDMIDRLYGNTDWQRTTPVDLLTIGIYQGKKYAGVEEGRYVNRLITGVLPGKEGICLFEPDIMEGAEVQFMARDAFKMVDSARQNSLELMETIRAEGRNAIFGLYIDCAGRSAAYSKTTVEEAAEVQNALNRFGCPFLGIYSGVEIAPFLGKSRGLDWTGLLLVFVRD